jgi:hypothetical protein
VTTTDHTKEILTELSYIVATNGMHVVESILGDDLGHWCASRQEPKLTRSRYREIVQSLDPSEIAELYDHLQAVT